MKSILILGGSGFIGNCLYKELAPYYNTFATYNTAKGYRNNQHFFYFNLEEGGLDSILKEVRPKLIISALRGDFNVQLETHDFLIKLIKKSDCRILFLSSSNVFDSFEHYPSYEYDKTFSKSIFGRFKIKIENELMRLPTGKFIIARLPMIFGLNAPRTIEIDKAVENNKMIEVFPNSIINVNSDIRLSQQIHYLINHKKTGLFHLGSTDLISHFDFIKNIVKRRHNTPGIFKHVYSSNTIRYIATLPKVNRLPSHILPSYLDVLDDLSIKQTSN